MFYHGLHLSVLEFNLQISNTHFFQTTEGLEFLWNIHGDGHELGSGILSLPNLAPQSSYDIEWESSPWHPLWASSSAKEIFLTVTAKLLHAIRWVEAGHVISSTQVQLPSRREITPHVIGSLFLLGPDIRYMLQLVSTKAFGL